MNGVMQPPHGLKPRYDLGIDWERLLTQVGIAFVVLAVVIAMAVAAWRWWKKRKANARRAGDPVVASGPGRVQELLTRVRELTPGEPFDAREREEFYWRLGLALRTAVEWRTGIGATSLTVRELREPLRKKLPLPSQETAEAIALLERGEGIKFAGVPVTPADAVAARDLTAKLIGRLFPGGGGP